MTDDPKPHKQTRDTFITLYNTRLFTSEQVWDMCHRSQCVEREKVLDVDTIGTLLNIVEKDCSRLTVIERGAYRKAKKVERELREGKDGE